MLLEALSLPLKAVPLRADFPRPGEDVAQQQKGECGIAAGDDGRGNHRHTAFCRFHLLHFACFHSKIKCTAIVFCKNADAADPKLFTADAAPL